MRLELTEAQVPVVYQVVRQAPPDARKRLRSSGWPAAGIPKPTIDRLLGFARAKSWAELRGVGAGLDAALAEGESLRHTLDALGAMGFGEYLDLDLGIVRGLAYYTGTVFELFDAKGELRAICGGGRYDNLLQSLGGVDLPALGFGMGDVVLGELLRDRGLAPAAASSIDVFLAAITEEDLAGAARSRARAARRGAPGRVRARAAGGGQAAQAGRRAERAGRRS